MVEHFAENKPAVAFWQKVIDRYCSGKFERRTGNSGATNVLLFCNGDGQLTRER
jgi:predicted acetyltransferase